MPAACLSARCHHAFLAPFDVSASPASFCNAAPQEMREFRPDVIIALGGGSPMDAAKVMWLM